MTKLSHFQENCGNELMKIFRDRGHESRSWEIVEGSTETYIQADLGLIKIWIYEDGACWQGRGRDRVFEAIDYDSLDDLQREFLAEVGSALIQ